MAREEGKQDTERHSLTLLPPPEWCVPHRTPSNGEGGVGALETSRDTETGQEACRDSVLGAMAGQGT